MMICYIRKAHTPSERHFTNVRLEHVAWKPNRDAHTVLAAEAVCKICDEAFKYTEELPVLLHSVIRSTMFSNLMKALKIKND